MIAFWIFMLIMEMTTPVIMLIFGNVFSNKAPKDINSVYGYRTKRSMKNKETWAFAHNYFGKMWKKEGIVLTILSAIAMLFCLGKSEEYVGNYGAVIMAIQIVLLIIPIFFTEAALKKNFDDDGNKRQ